MKTSGLLLTFFFAFSPGAVASPSPVLIPTMYNGPGAFGSRWSTLLVLNNHDSEAFSSPGVSFGILCAIPEGCTSADVPPGAFGTIATPLPPNGLLLYLPSADTPVSFVARFAATPRSAVAGGSELPVVREQEFTTRALQLPYIPLQPRTNPLRTALRIYAPDAQPGTSVSVELRSWTTPDGPPQYAKIVSVDAPTQTITPPIYPGYAQVTLQDAFPGAVHDGAIWNVTVTPQPLDATTTPRIWAFVTVTDNVTQEVTVQRPQ